MFNYPENTPHVYGTPVWVPKEVQGMWEQVEVPFPTAGIVQRWVGTVAFIGEQDGKPVLLEWWGEVHPSNLRGSLV